jgi:superfamily II RNA helicase
MLTRLKESVEMLLADGYLKVPFCASIFAVRINVVERTCPLDRSISDEQQSKALPK